MTRTTDSRAAAEQRLEALMSQHLDFVWRLMRRLGLSAADADDASQTVFIVASDKLEHIQVGSERSYLYGIAVRVHANTRRVTRRRREVADLKLDHQSPGALPDDRVEWMRATALLDDLLAQLPSILRRALVLAEIEQCSMPEIAELEQIPLGTAASRVRRARSRFRQLLDAGDQGNPFRKEDA